MRRGLMLTTAAGTLIAGILLMPAAGETTVAPATDTHSALMRAKLACTQKIVEGLVSQDFGLIHRGADELRKITEATAWEANEDQIYAHYRGDLRRMALKLMLLAEEQNLDGAAFTYMHGLTTCISCHSHCRDVLHIARDEPKLHPVPAPERGPRTPTILR